jgi:hypothetical protein
MFKRKLAVLCLVTVALFAFSGVANAGIIDPCVSWVHLTAATTPAPLLCCPIGDTASFIAQGWYITVHVLDANGAGVANIPATDFWVIDCDPVNDLALCGGGASSGADSNTNAAGTTTMSQTALSAGGCVDGIAVVVQGFAIADSAGGCTQPVCLPVSVRSIDITGDLVVDISDLSLFAQAYPPYPPAAYNTCADFDLSGTPIDVSDLSVFAFHYPSHDCP